jgi:hypothetical protein
MPVVARRSVLWLVASAIAACSSGSSGGAAPAALYKSGTRLRARVTDGGGGARRFDRWYDTQLETPCTFQPATDGVRRCLPMADTINGVPDYLDDACSVPVVTYVDPYATASFVATEASRVPGQPAGCGADVVAAGTTYEQIVVAAWRIGPEQPNTGALFYRDGSGGCSQRPVSSGPVHVLEAIVPPQLVGVKTVTIEARGPSMAVEVLTADDGSEAVGQMFDTTLGRPCFPSWGWAVIDDYRCYASTAQATTAVPQGCGAGAVASCADEIFLDGSVCAPSFHTLAAAPCGASGSAGFSYYEFGAPFDPQRFPSLTTDRAGTGRLRLEVTRPSDDDRALFVNPGLFVAQDRYTPGPFFDTERQLPCDAVTFEDGTIRCLTSDAQIDDTYSDPDCTNPIARQSSPPQVCGTIPPPPTPQLAFFRRLGRLYTLGSLVARTEAYTRSAFAVNPTCDRLPYPAMYYDLVPADPGMLGTLRTFTE